MMNAVGSSTCTNDVKKRKLNNEQTLIEATVGVGKQSGREQQNETHYCEPSTDDDSLHLFVLGVDLIPTMMSFLEFDEVAQCEMTCKTLQNLTKEYWIERDNSLSNDAEESKVMNDNPRIRVIRWCIASRLAKRLEPLIASHSCRKRGIRADCKGCDAFPNELAHYVTICNNPDEYEIFVRLSDKSKDTPLLLFEGFVPHQEFKEYDEIEHPDFKDDDFRVIYIQPHHLNMAEWPTGHCEASEWLDPMTKVMDNLSVTLVVVQKGAVQHEKMGLLAAQEQFCDCCIEGPNSCGFWRSNNVMDTRPHDAWSTSPQRDRWIEFDWDFDQQRECWFRITVW